MLLENTTNPLMSYILLGVLVLIIIIGPIFMKRRNKKESERMQAMVDSLKKGDKVITSAGVFGKVIGVEEKEGFKLVTIETGNEKNKSYLTMDVGAIYANLSATPVTQPVAKPDQETPKPEEKPEETVTENAEVIPQEQEIAEVKEEPIDQPKQAEPAKNKAKAKNKKK